MMDGQIRRFIQEEIKRQMNIILNSETGQTTESTETIQNLFPGMPSIPDRPVSHTYGISSRAPQGTISVVARVGDHFGNRMVIGHRDKNRPTLNEGETILYDAYGHIVYCSQSKIQIGSKGASEPFVLGNVLQSLLSQFLQLVANHTHSNFLIGPPDQSGQFTALKSSPVDDGAIKSDEIFGEKG